MLTTGDPLRLFQRSAERMREQAWLVDADRVFQRVVANLAIDPATYLGADQSNDDLEEGLDACIDHAIEQLLQSDQEEVRARNTEHDPDDPRFEFLMYGFAVPARLTREASVGFNALPAEARRAFFVLLIETRSVEEALAAGLGPPERLRANCLRGLRALIDIGNSPDRGSNGPGESGSTG